MADPARERSVYRYFDLADSFVQILLKDPSELSIQGRPGMGRAAYRRMVIEACMPQFSPEPSGGELGDALETLFPDDPLMVEDLLYQLCVEINPALDIHEVRLSADGSTQLEAQPDGGGDDAQRLRRGVEGLEKRLARSVLGQDEAVAAVAHAMRKAAVGLAPEGRPLASLLFCGRTGTGKTELARSLARELFAREGDGREGGLIRIDCSEFALPHEYAKLIGSPPGYVGHDSGGRLTEALAERPGSVVLFDEVEKAHPKLHNLLLQVLEEGVMTDSKGRRVSFEQAVVILTSNAGATELENAARPVGFNSERGLDRAAQESITRDALATLFRPELLGRLDRQILFRELDLDVVEAIAAQKLRELCLRTRKAGARVAFTPAVARWVARRGFSPEYGAREVRRVLQQEIEPRITDALLDGLSTTQLLRVRVQRGELLFRIEE